MGLLGLFKKKEVPKPQKPQNNPNSVFTLQFVVPYFSIFDRTNPALKSYSIKLAIGGSVQYRISEPTLCFNNIPLGEMSPEQLEKHVSDSLRATLKAFILSIETIPLLQFESAIAKINAAAKAHLVPTFEEEYGINLRMFNISRFTYDEEDPNYIKLTELSHDALAHMRNMQNIESQRQEATLETQSKIELNAMKRAEELRDKRERLEHEASLVDTELSISRKRNDFEQEKTLAAKSVNEIDLGFEERRKRLETDMYVQRKNVDAQAEFVKKNGSVASTGDCDFNAIDDSNDFKIEGL